MQTDALKKDVVFTKIESDQNLGETWEKKFAQEKSEIVDRIANAIFKQIIDRIEKFYLSSPNERPIQKRPWIANYNLNPPAYADKLLKNNVPEGTVVHSWMTGETSSNFNKLEICQRLKEISLAAKEILNQMLSTYTEKPENHHVNFSVKVLDYESEIYSFNNPETIVLIVAKTWFKFENSDENDLESKTGRFSAYLWGMKAFQE